MDAHRTLAALASVAAVVLLVASPVVADGDGTGLSLGRGLDLMNLVLGTDWDSSIDDHQDYVEDFGVGSCAGCHNPEAQGYDNGFAPGCVTCHEAEEWCGTAGSGSFAVCDGEPPVLSTGSMLHTALGVDWTDVTEQHQDFADDRGVGMCAGCHSLVSGGKASPSTFDAPGCLSCHGVEWDDGDDGSDDDSSSSDDLSA